MGNKAEKINPFTITWNIISTVGGVLGLVSFADDFIVWKNIMSDLLTLYRSIVHIPILFLALDLIQWSSITCFLAPYAVVPFIKRCPTV